MNRSANRWGTKRYAMKEMRGLMRAWARSRRKLPYGSLYGQERDIAFGKVIGARTALIAVGAITHEQYEKLNRRVDRIIEARITRRPFAELRCAA